MKGWSDIVGNRRAVEVLRRSCEGERASHAYLLVGRAGLGKSLVAEVLARTLLCEGGVGVERPCGECRSCRIEPGEHPDWHIVRPEGSTIKIDQVRSVQKELPYRPHWGVRRVLCFDPADTLTDQAQNSLLKSLEDPPPYAVFILVAHHIGNILPTVRSRCAQVRFHAVPAAEIAAALEAQGVEPESAELMAALAFGSPALAFQQDEGELRERRERVLGWTELLQRGRAPVWHIGEALEEQKEELEAHVDMLLLWYRDILLASSGVPAGRWVNQDYRERIEEEAASVTPRGAVAALHALLRLKEHVHRNANFRLAVDVALTQVQRGLAQ